MRLFTAIPLPKEKKDLVASITRGRLSVPYVNTSNLHITLNFFGELTDDEIEKVKNLFGKFSLDSGPINIEFDRLTQFRQQLHLTVKPNEGLNKLHNELEKLFRASGFTFQERNYYPHVKLANLHMDKVMNRERKIENFPNEELQQLNFVADKVVLFSSKLLLHHPHHESLVEIELI